MSIRFDQELFLDTVDFIFVTMATRYECKLPDDLLEKAINELNEPRDNAERLKAIDDFRAAFKGQYPETKLQREDDVFLLRFLRAKKFNQAKAINTLFNYLTMRPAWTEVYERVKNPVLISDALNSGTVVPLSGKAKDGSTVVLGRPGLGETNLFLDLFADVVLTMEALLEREDMQICGITVIQDMAYLSMDMVKQINPLVMKQFLSIVQDCMPVRVKGLNATNEPKIFDILYSVIYPLMREKMRKRFRLHGQDFSTLYTLIDRNVLPPMFAGNGPEVDAEGWKNVILGEQTQL